MTQPSQFIYFLVFFLWIFSVHYTSTLFCLYPRVLTLTPYDRNPPHDDKTQPRPVFMAHICCPNDISPPGDSVGDSFFLRNGRRRWRSEDGNIGVLFSIPFLILILVLAGYPQGVGLGCLFLFCSIAGMHSSAHRRLVAG